MARLGLGRPLPWRVGRGGRRQEWAGIVTSVRLLTHCSYDTDKEIRYLELLKLRFEEVPLHQCEVMLKDIGSIKRINSLFLTVDGGCPELQTQTFPVNSLILSAQFWPHFKAKNLELTEEVTVSLIHTAIIYKFQEAAEWTVQKLTRSLKVPLSTLRRKITFWQSQGVLVEITLDIFTLVEDGSMKRGSG